jgi:hypothetical protein
MAAMFGHSWLSQYGPAPDGVGGDTWSAVLADLSPQQIGAGLQSLSRIPSDWPPTAPRFRALCLDVPPLAQVRLELRANPDEKSPFLRQLWSYVDGYRYRQASANDADRMVRDAYDMAVAFVMEGGELPKPATAIEPGEPEPPKPADPDVARRHIAEIGLILKTGGDVLTEDEAAIQIQHANSAPTIQDHLAELERQSEPDFRRRAAGDVDA